MAATNPNDHGDVEISRSGPQLVKILPFEHLRPKTGSIRERFGPEATFLCTYGHALPVEAQPEAVVVASAAMPSPDPDPSAISIEEYTDPNRYHLAIPEDAMYGWAKDAAHTFDSPWGYTYTTILAWFAGMAQWGLPDANGDMIQNNIYVAQLGGVGVGKSLAMRRVNKALHPGDFNAKHILNRAPASDRGLFTLVGYDIEKDKNGQDVTVVPDLKFRTILVDELGGMLTKMGIQNSTLAQTLCTLWCERHDGSSAKSSNQACYVQLSICGCLPVADPSEFTEMFSDVTGRGLYDRFIIVPGPTSWKASWSKRGRPTASKLANYKPEPVETPDDALEMLNEWRDANPEICTRCPRSLEIARIIAELTAALNHDGLVTKAGMQAALRFVEWQAEVKAEYKPSRAKNDQGKITEVVRAAFRKAEAMFQAGKNAKVDGKMLILPNGFVHLTSLARKFHLYDNHGGPNIRAQVRSLVGVGDSDGDLIAEKVATGKDGSGPQKETGYYRYNITREVKR